MTTTTRGQRQVRFVEKPGISDRPGGFIGIRDQGLPLAVRRSGGRPGTEQSGNRASQSPLHPRVRLENDHPSACSRSDPFSARPQRVSPGHPFFCKYPSASRGDKFVAWHQDLTYWGLEPPQAVTAWLAIDDVDIDNGCMRVVPGSHRQGILTHETSAMAGNLLSINQEIPRGEL